MAKIQGFREQVREVPTSSSGPINPNVAGARGQQQAQLGKEIIDFGLRVGEAQKIKDRSDEALFQSEMFVLGMDAQAKALNTVQYNDKMRKDGKDVMQEYNLAFDEAYAHIDSLQDSKRKRMGRAIVDKIRLNKKVQEDLFELSNTRHVVHEGTALEDLSQELSTFAGLDPLRTAEFMEYFSRVVDKSSFSVEQKHLINSTGRKTIVKGTIDKMRREGDFERARDFLNSSVGTEAFTDKEKQAEITRLDQQEWQYFSRNHTKERIAIKKLERERKEQQEQKAVEVSEQFFNARNTNDPVKMEGVLRQARVYEALGFLSKGTSDNLVKSTKVTDALSRHSRLKFYDELYKKDTNLKDLHDRIFKSQFETINPEDAEPIIKEIAKRMRSKGKGKDAINRERTRAWNMMKTKILTKVYFDIPDGTPDDKLDLFYNVQQTMAENEARGMNPIPAAESAMKKWGQPRLFTPKPKKSNAKELRKYGAKRMKEFRDKKRSGKLTRREKEEYLREAKDISDQLQVMESNMDDLRPDPEEKK